ncbi:MAG TPA: PAS domain S-box protein [Desulfobacterales bacterium]
MDTSVPEEVYQSFGDNITFHTLAEKSLTGILIISRDEIHYVNKKFEEITGYNRFDLLKMSPWDMVHPDERIKIRAQALDRFDGRSAPDFYETQWIHKNGDKIWVEVRAVLLENTDPPKILANILDTTVRKKAVEKLKRREQDLEIQSKKLEETNTALKVILRQRNAESEELKKNMHFNVEKLIMPYLDELAVYQANSRCSAFLQTIKENLREITAPHIRIFSSQYEKLSPRQVEVINLVRQGKTSKEISEILGVSKAAVDFHRNNIRKKLQLNHKKINLRTYLDLKEPELNGRK